MKSCSLMLENKHYHDINPLICGWEEWDTSHSYGPAVRDYLLLHYVHSGCGFFEKQGQRHRVEPGEMFVILPGEATYYQADSLTPWSYTWVGFTTALELPACLQQPVVDAIACDGVFRELAHRRQDEGAPELFVMAKICELLAILGGSDTATDTPLSYLRRAKNYRKTSFTQSITVEGIAAALGLERSYFSRIFAQGEGMPPQQYLVRLRLRHAARLLGETGCTVAEAAAGCGYNDPVNFSRMFKRYYGVSPKNYRLQPENSC